MDTLCFRYKKADQINHENISATKENLIRRNVRVRGEKVSMRHLAIIQRSISNDAEFAKKIPFRRQSIFPFGKSNISPLQDPIQYQGFDDYYCQQIFIELIFNISTIEWNTSFLILVFVQSHEMKQSKIELTIYIYFFLTIVLYQKAWFQPPKCKTASWPITAVAHMSMLLSIMFNFFELLSHSKYNRVAFQYCLYRASTHNYAPRPNKPSVIYYLSCL